MTTNRDNLSNKKRDVSIVDLRAESVLDALPGDR